MSDDRIAAELARAGEAVQTAKRSLSAEEQEARETAESRRFITRTVLYTWIGALAVYAAAAASGIGAANALLEIIKIAVRPLVTLVLGFYLSRAR